MGFDIGRFCGTVDEELICPICAGVLDDPLQVKIIFFLISRALAIFPNSFLFIQFQAPTCEHAFCKRCIQEWLNHQPVCPVDRQCITPIQLRPVPRILKNLLSR